MKHRMNRAEREELKRRNAEFLRANPGYYDRTSDGELIASDDDRDYGQDDIDAAEAVAEFRR